jgi:hypothetical protein
MTTTDQDSTKPKSIDDDKTALENASAQGKRADTLKPEIVAAIAKRDQTAKAYAGKRPELYQRWSGQIAESKVLHDAIASAYPTWPTIITTKICPILDDIKARKKSINDRLTTNDAAVAKATEDFKNNKANLDGWLALDQSLTKNLDKIDKAIQDIQALLGGPDQVFAVYLFWFVVQPALRNVAPKDEHTLQTDSSAPECLPPFDPSCPSLVDPGQQYSDRIDAAWKAYEDAVDTKKTTEDALKKFADGLTADRAALGDLIQKREQNIKASLKS